jgi:ABC-type multidrug transport system fused ATPase/permease subunit
MALFLCGLAGFISLLEGINVGLLVPLLENLQSPEQAGGHWISKAVAKVFDFLGVPFELATIVVALTLIVGGIAGLRYWRMILVGRLREGFTSWIRYSYMKRLLDADLSFFHGERLGVMTDTLTTQSHQAGGSIMNMVELVALFGMVLAYLLAAFFISPIITAGAVLVLLAVILGMQLFVARARATAKVLVDRSYDLQVAGLESLSGIQVVKSFLLEPMRWAEYTRRSNGVADGNYRLIKNQSQMTVIQEVFLFALVGAIIVVGVSVMDLSISVMVALLYVLFRLMPRITGLNAVRQGLAESMVSVHAVTVAMENASRPTIVSGKTPFVHLQSDIKLKDVDFSYNGSGEVLRETTFTIEQGRMTAIVGASGVGKTTLVDLLLRFYDPLRGSIEVDGVDLRELDLASWRRSIGLVSQDVFLFNDTVANNIALGRPGVTQGVIEDAARQAYAHDFIRQLPQGYDTRIGDRGWNLSGGQRQRIALARAIAQRPQILVLDEATSSLDSESEQLIQDYINEIRGTCTMVVVAHRTATVRGADKIVVLQDGKIVEEGDWNKLMAANGKFASYQHLQSSGQ